MAGWTCPECGIDYDAVAPADIPDRVRQATSDIAAECTTAAEEAVRRRPAPEVWSPLEYAAHVDATLVDLGSAIERMLAEDAPEIGFGDPDEDGAPAVGGVVDVLRGLGDAAGSYALTVQKVGDDQWSRTATFPWGERDVLTIARNGVHESVHHLMDVRKGLRQP
jgi:hypothetical protein